MTQKTETPPEGKPPRQVIFVGGAPRSGTSVTHALLCTAEAANRYHPEIGYVRPVLESYVVGMKTWKVHTKTFFSEPEHFKLHIRKLLHTQMNHISRVLGFPRVLCVKDPLLTPLFPQMHQVMGWPTRFVTVVRHPHNVVRSLQEVVERRGDDFDDDLIEFAVNDYLNSYKHLESPVLQDALFCLRYEDLNAPETLDALRKFTDLPGIDPDTIWGKDKRQTSAAESSDPWFSPKYHQPIDLKSRLSPLAPHIRDVVNDVCGAFMADYGYNPDGTWD